MWALPLIDRLGLDEQDGSQTKGNMEYASNKTVVVALLSSPGRVDAQLRCAGRLDKADV